MAEAPLSLLECGHCAGLWVSADVFRHLETLAQKASLPPPTTRPARAGIPLSQPNSEGRGPVYRPCVECGQLMLRRNYNRRSGVLIDVCAQHGVWFDDGELSSTIEWIRSGRHLSHNQTATTQESEPFELYRPGRRSGSQSGTRPLLTGWPNLDTLADGFYLLDAIFEIGSTVFELFD